MTRAEARQIITDWLAVSEGEKGQCGYIEGWFYEKDVEAFHMAIKALEQEPNVVPSRATGKWIPVSERLPEEDEDVLVTVYFRGLNYGKHKNGWNDDIKPCYYVDIAKHIGGEWSSMSDEYKVALNRHVVIAWQPLPEPHKGE